MGTPPPTGHHLKLLICVVQADKDVEMLNGGRCQWKQEPWDSTLVRKVGRITIKGCVCVRVFSTRQEKHHRKRHGTQQIKQCNWRRAIMYEKPHECNWKARLELAVEGFEQQTTTWGESLKLILSGGIHLLISLISSHLLATCHKLVVG